MLRQLRSGITKLEVLVAVALISLIIALLVPAVRKVRAEAEYQRFWGAIRLVSGKDVTIFEGTPDDLQAAIKSWKTPPDTIDRELRPIEEMLQLYRWVEIDGARTLVENPDYDRNKADKWAARTKVFADGNELVRFLKRLRGLPRKG